MRRRGWAVEMASEFSEKCVDLSSEDSSLMCNTLDFYG